MHYPNRYNMYYAVHKTCSGVCITSPSWRLARSSCLTEVLRRLRYRWLHSVQFSSKSCQRCGSNLCSTVWIHLIGWRCYERFLQVGGGGGCCCERVAMELQYACLTRWIPYTWHRVWIAVEIRPGRAMVCARTSKKQ